MSGIVLSRPDRIGDVIVSSSCFEPLRQALPGAELHFIAQSRMEPLFRRHPALRTFYGISSHIDEARRQDSLVEHLRQLKASCIVHLHSDPMVECAAAAAEIPRRIGFSSNGSKHLTDLLPDEKKQGRKHEGYYNFDLLELLGVKPPPSLQANLSPDLNALDRLAGRLPGGLLAGPYAVVHIGAHGDKPRISAEILSTVVRWLVHERRCYVVLIGAEKNDPHLAAILASLGSAASWTHNFAGQSDLAETAFLLRDAAVVFGRDSGPAHLAAAMGARTLTLMLEPEPENSAQRWKPLGPRSWVLEKPLRRGWIESRPSFARRNLRQYAPAEILAALQQAMEA
jgi:ADP-heptose:LPS heptosyltransferase